MSATSPWDEETARCVQVSGAEMAGNEGLPPRPSPTRTSGHSVIAVTTHRRPCLALPERSIMGMESRLVEAPSPCVESASCSGSVREDTPRPQLCQGSEQALTGVGPSTLKMRSRSPRSETQSMRPREMKAAAVTCMLSRRQRRERSDPALPPSEERRRTSFGRRRSRSSSASSVPMSRAVQSGLTRESLRREDSGRTRVSSGLGRACIAAVSQSCTASAEQDKSRAESGE
mmetsp:Transcript_24030/g.73600  ORF Transcript_24030/g.73600 Transcript_24030/m.73600 type:complete len:231 (+) Transcript_24030:575-1267(+)|eukprot:scaffold82127_cov31-Tisochrysis_lutea.AAC.4